MGWWVKPYQELLWQKEWSPLASWDLWVLQIGQSQPCLHRTCQDDEWVKDILIRVIYHVAEIRGGPVMLVILQPTDLRVRQPMHQRPHPLTVQPLIGHDLDWFPCC